MYMVIKEFSENYFKPVLKTTAGSHLYFGIIKQKCLGSTSSPVLGVWNAFSCRTPVKL